MDFSFLFMSIDILAQLSTTLCFYSKYIIFTLFRIRENISSCYERKV